MLRPASRPGPASVCGEQRLPLGLSVGARGHGGQRPEPLCWRARRTTCVGPNSAVLRPVSPAGWDGGCPPRRPRRGRFRPSPVPGARRTGSPRRLSRSLDPPAQSEGLGLHKPWMCGKDGAPVTTAGPRHSSGLGSGCPLAPVPERKQASGGLPGISRPCPCLTRPQQPPWRFLA